MTGIRGGIIAAGHGERLRAGGWAGPKPLLPVAGRPLIGHAIDNLRRAGIENIAVLLNTKAEACAEWVGRHVHDARIEIMHHDTVSSFESFCRVARQLNGAPALITTVDGIMAGPGLRPAAEAIGALPDDGLLLGITDLVDDEKPLWVAHDAGNGRVERIGGASGTAVAAGVYGVPRAFVAPRGDEFPRLRDYLAAFAASGRPVMGVMLAGVVDVDRRCDVAVAERRIDRGVS